MCEYSYALTGRSKQFVSRLRTRGPALIHAHFGQSGVLALPISETLRIPLIVTYHGFDATASDAAIRHGYIGRMYLAYRDRLKSHPVHVIAVSEFIANRLIAQGFSRDRITVHYTGVDVERFVPDPTISRQKAILFVGRFVEKKGCEYLIRAMARVRNNHPDARLILIGDGPLRGHLEALANELHVNADFLGSQPLNIVQKWMQQAWVLCVPSVTAKNGDCEGLGMVFLEAQASGLPVITTRHGPIPEAVIHGETGLLVEECDASALAESLSILLGDINQHARLSRNARDFVCKTFDIRTQTARLELLYDRVSAST
jgi:colanic acid/amylovoran biosynthesis glycosyltransferase